MKVHSEESADCRRARCPEMKSCPLGQAIRRSSLGFRVVLTPGQP